MLGKTDAWATIAVKDGERAKAFYQDILGLEPAEDRPGVRSYRSGGSIVLVYESEFAGTNKATSATWAVDDLDAVVTDLKAKGVAFEHYPDMPGLTLDGDIHVGGDMRVAWLKDPDGNTLAFVSES